jgi:hypothetical protein
MPTLNDVLAGSLAQAVQLQQVIDALKGTPNKGVPVALVSLNDPNNYALTVQNDDPINSRALSVLKADGTTLISADATGVTLGAPVNLPPGSISGTAIAAGSITNAMLGPDVARANLLPNGSMEIWSRGNGAFSGTVGGVYTADRWMALIAGTSTLSVSKDTTNQDAASLACAALTYVHNSPSFLINPFAAAADGGLVQQLRGKTITFSVRVRTSVAGAVSASLFGTALTRVFGTTHTGNGAYQTLTVSGTVPSNETNLQVELQLAASCTAYVDNAMLVIGSQAATYVPMHPADEQARCQRYYEIIGETATTFAMQGYATAGGLLQAWLPYKVRKAVAPTLTKNGTWAVANAAQPTFSGAGMDGASITVTVTALGMSAIGNNTAGNTIVVEGNP